MRTLTLDLGSGEETVWSLLKTFRDGIDKKVKQCQNARFLIAKVPLVKKEVKRILPVGMWLSNPPMATLFVVNYIGPTFTVPYKEAGLMIHVRTPFGKGMHCCWMVMDDDTAMIYGRETLAFPKKRADFVFEEQDDHIKASVNRRGTEVLAITAERGLTMKNPGPVFDIKTFNIGGIGQLLALNWVWCFRITETIREAYNVKASVTVKFAKYDPIARLISGEPVSARFVVTDVTGTRYLFPAGLAGLKWYANTFVMRIR